MNRHSSLLMKAWALDQAVRLLASKAPLDEQGLRELNDELDRTAGRFADIVSAMNKRIRGAV